MVCRASACYYAGQTGLYIIQPVRCLAPAPCYLELELSRFDSSQTQIFYFQNIQGHVQPTRFGPAGWVSSLKNNLERLFSWDYWPLFVFRDIF